VSMNFAPLDQQALDGSVRNHRIDNDDSAASPNRSGMRRRSSFFNSSIMRILTAEEEQARLEAFEEVSKPKNGRGGSKNVHDEVIVVPRAPKPTVVASKGLLPGEGLMTSPDGVLFVNPTTAAFPQNSSAEEGRSPVAHITEVYRCPDTSIVSGTVMKSEQQQQQQSGSASLMFVRRPLAEAPRSAAPDSWRPLFLPLSASFPVNVSGFLLDTCSGDLRVVAEDDAAVTDVPENSFPESEIRGSQRTIRGATKKRRKDDSRCPQRSIVPPQRLHVAPLLPTKADADLRNHVLSTECERMYYAVPITVGKSERPGDGTLLAEALAAAEGASIITDPSSGSLLIYGGMSLAPEGQSFLFRRTLISVSLVADASAPSALRCRFREVPTGGVAYPPGIAFHSACHTEDGKMIVFGGILDAQLARSSSSTGAAGHDKKGPGSPATSPTRSSGNTAARSPAWRFCGRACCVSAADDSLPRASTLLKPSTFSDSSSATRHSTGLSGSSQGNARADPSADPLHPEEVVLERNKPLHLLCANGTYVFDCKSLRWSQMRCVGDVPTGRLRHAAAIAGNWMFVAGGVSEHNKPFRDLFALHVASGVWTAVAAEAVPSSPICMMVASPVHLLLFTASNGTQSLNLVELTPHVSAKRRVAIQRIEAAARAASHPDEVAAGKSLVPLSRKELDLQIARLTYERMLPDHLLDPRVLAVKQMQEKTYLAFGVACPLRTITLPPTKVEAAVERLYDAGRGERREERRERALSLYDREPPIRTKLAGGSKLRLRQLVDDLYTKPLALYKTKHESRVDKCLKQLQEQRIPPRLRSPDSGQPADSSEVAREVTERLYADVARRAARLQESMDDTEIDRGEAHHAGDDETFLRLYRNEASRAERQALFEELVVKKEEMWSPQRGKSRSPAV
jgi:hypothetical protein